MINHVSIGVRDIAKRQALLRRGPEAARLQVPEQGRHLARLRQRQRGAMDQRRPNAPSPPTRNPACISASTRRPERASMRFTRRRWPPAAATTASRACAPITARTTTRASWSIPTATGSRPIAAATRRSSHAERRTAWLSTARASSRSSPLPRRAQPIVGRIWSGRTRREIADEYLAYLYEHGVLTIEVKPGNLGVQLFRRFNGDVAEFTVISYWRSYRRHGGDAQRPRRRRPPRRASRPRIPTTCWSCRSIVEVTELHVNDWQAGPLNPRRQA